ncbi:BTAD domain-containing putative transcriptional regulator, partial [Streptomyces sp. MCAF7]
MTNTTLLPEPPGLRLRLLGPMEAEIGGEPIRLGGSRQQIVLATLALETDHTISLDRLIRAVWDDDPPSTARSQIHICISALRRTLTVDDTSVIVTRPPGYMLSLPRGGIDTHQFSGLVARARTVADQGDITRAADDFHAALALWRGPALAGIPSAVVQVGATQLDEARLTATEERISLDLRLGRHHELAGELQALATAQPFREKAHGHLMLALYRS